jgi:hyperosmotically inducible periplasmic protein
MNMRTAVALAMLGVMTAVVTSGCVPTQQPSGPAVPPDDGALVERVRAALNSGGLDASQIDVSSSRGVVILTGFARDQQTIERVEVIARRVAGVAGVRNDIQLLGGGPERRR